MDKKNSAIIMLSIIIFILSTTLVAVFSTGVDTNSEEMEKFVGKWTPSVRPIKIYTSYNFKEDGTFVRITETDGFQTEIKNGTYKVQDGKLILTFEDSEVIVYQYIFSNNNSVILIDSTALEEIFNAEAHNRIHEKTKKRR